MRRIVLLVVVVALAGCSGASVESDGATPTVTPAPVPDDDANAERIEGPTVDGAERGRAHERTLSLPHTRIHDLKISQDGLVLLEYRETATLGAGDESRLRRAYSGPLTAEFVPYVEGASSAREERYVTPERVARRQSVDGIERERSANGPPALVAPLLVTDDRALVAALLDGGRVAERTRSLGARMTHDRVHPSAVPQVLDDPRNGTLSATMREDGRVTRITVGYEATLDGEPVVVEQSFRWDRPTEPVEPEWAGE
jgi:hypothetical protein